MLARIRLVVALALLGGWTLWSGLGPGGSLAFAQVDTSRLEQLERDAERYQQLLRERQAEIERLSAALRESEAELGALVGERDRLRAQVAQVRLERDATQAEIARLQGERTDTLQRIQAKEAELDALEARIQGLLVNLHRRRSPRFAQVLSQAETFHDLEVKNHLLGLLARQDVALVNDLNTVLAELAQLQGELSRQIAEQTEQEAALADQELQLRSAENDLQAVIDRLDATIAGQQAQRRAALQQQAETDAQLQQIIGARQRERSRVEEAQRQRQQALQRLSERERRQREQLRQQDTARAAREVVADTLDPLPSGYVYPVQGRVSSGFGEGQRSYVTFRASEARAAVRAVADGEVIVNQSAGANDGFIVAVEHDNSLVSVYGNLRPPLVELGDRVARGQVIGFLGGGALVPEDELRFYLSPQAGSGFVDPLPRLGF